MRASAFILAVWVAACTSPNPRSCKDGTCTDPAFPFCDIDGALAGTPDTCLAVTCTTGDVAGCRADTALVCNAAGNDYDLVSCQHGCDPIAGCTQCTASDQCPTSAPVCDAAGACRGCEKDDECASLVCEDGTCAAENGILYAASNGADNSACTRAAPCTASRAISTSVGAAAHPTVRLLPGTYPTGITLTSATGAPLEVVATGATIVAAVPVTVQGAADVGLRGATLVGTMTVVECNSASSQSKLRLTGSTLTAANQFTVMVDVGNCVATFDTATIDATGDLDAAISVGNNGRFEGNRLHVIGNPAQPSGVASVFAKRAWIQLTNSLLEDVLIDLYTADTMDPGSVLSLGNNTIVRSGFSCRDDNAAAYRTVVFDNNIIYNPGVLDAVATPAQCMFRNNVIYPQATAMPGNILADPAFVDATADYHLKLRSPAVDAAVASGYFPMFTPDLDGVVRPQGGAADVGAYERKP